MGKAITTRGETDFIISLDPFEYKLLKDAVHHLIEINKINEQSGFRKGGFSTIEDLTDLMYKLEGAEQVENAGEFRTLHEWEEYLDSIEEAESYFTSLMGGIHQANPHMAKEEITPTDVYAPGKKIRRAMEEMIKQGLPEDEIAGELNKLFLKQESPLT
jgi:hypothetical protein